MRHLRRLPLVLPALALALGVAQGASPAAASPDSETVLLEGPVRVTTSSAPEIFPESWRRPPVSATGAALASEEFGHARAILGRAMRKYPRAVLDAHLKAVYMLSQLRFSGVSTAGTNSLTAVYVKIGPKRRGFTDAYIEGVFHAEFSSILLRNRARDFPATAWQKINAPSFRYSGDGVGAVRQNKSGTTPSEELAQQGFLNQYAQASVEEDFNSFAILLFSGDKALWELADKHPRLQQKRRLAMRFYRKLDPAFTERYFRSLQAP